MKSKVQVRDPFGLTLQSDDGSVRSYSRFEIIEVEQKEASRLFREGKIFPVDEQKPSRGKKISFVEER